jgi:hypothetical protein
MVTLGRDCTLSFGGGSVNATVRDATYSASARGIQFQPFGQRRIRTHTTGYSEQFEVVFTDDPGLWTALKEGTIVAVSGTGLTGNFVVMDVQRSEPLDDIVTHRVALESA